MKKLKSLLIIIFGFTALTSCSEGELSLNSMSEKFSGTPRIVYIKPHSSSEYGRVFRSGQDMYIAVVFSVPIYVDTSSTSPQLNLEITNGTPTGSAPVVATYMPGYGSHNSITFKYPVSGSSMPFTAVHALSITPTSPGFPLKIINSQTQQPIALTLPHPHSNEGLWRQARFAIDNEAPFSGMGGILSLKDPAAQASSTRTPIMNNFAFAYGDQISVSVVNCSTSISIVSGINSIWPNMYLDLSQYGVSMSSPNTYRYEITGSDLAGNTGFVSSTCWSITDPTGWSLVANVFANSSWLYVNQSTQLWMEFNRPLETATTYNLSIVTGGCNAILGTDFDVSSMSFQFNPGEYRKSITVTNKRTDTSSTPCATLSIPGHGSVSINFSGFPQP